MTLRHIVYCLLKYVVVTSSLEVEQSEVSHGISIERKRQADILAMVLQ